MAQLAPDTDKSSLRKGQKFDQQRGIITQFTEQDTNRDYVEASLLGQANTDITPTDGNSSLVRVTTIPSSAILAFSRAFQTQINLSSNDIPDTLNGFTVVYETSEGQGDATETAEGASVGENASLSIPLQASAQSSAAIIPDLQPDITPNGGEHLPATGYLFYIADGSTRAQILTRLTALAGATVNNWPKFSRSAITRTFTLKGQRASVQAGANAKQSVSTGDTQSYIKGTGRSESYEISNIVRSVRIGPVIHAALTITPASQTQNIIASAGVIIGGAGTTWPEVTSSETAEATLTASVTPSSIPATSPVSSVPSTGLYLYDIRSEISEWTGYTSVYAVVFNFADLT